MPSPPLPLSTPADIDAAYLSLFSGLSEYRAAMLSLDASLGDGWLSLVEAEREGRTNATLNATAYQHRDVIAARLRVAAPASSSADGGADEQDEAVMVDLSKVEPGSDIWQAANALALASASGSAAGKPANAGADGENSGGDDSDEYDFADDPELRSLVSAAGGSSPAAAAALRNRKSTTSKKTAVSSRAAAGAEDTEAGGSEPVAPVYVSAEATQRWFAPLPLPALLEAQTLFSSATAAAVELAGRRARLIQLLSSLERLNLKTFSIEDGDSNTTPAAAPVPASAATNAKESSCSGKSPSKTSASGKSAAASPAKGKSVIAAPEQDAEDDGDGCVVVGLAAAAATATDDHCDD